MHGTQPANLLLCRPHGHRQTDTEMQRERETGDLFVLELLVQTYGD